MEKWVGKVALVTGASSGIGQDVALALANAGMVVVGIARRAELVALLSTQVTGSGKIYAKKCDVGSESEIMESLQWIRREFGGVDVLINNAGIFRYNFITQSETTDFRDTFNVNVLATCIFVREVIKDMKERESKGHIVLLNSLLGKRVPDVSVPVFGVYPASKYALVGLAEVLRQELNFFKLPIKLTSIHPGMVQTDMIKVFESQLAERLPKLQVKDITSSIIHCLETPPHVRIDEITLMPAM
ncbi:farnesol dehydrogenase [Anopheles ziemanni]|uniref:farnesol dehydrogenase n=1 Tax=Anopheles coustani TaxID=139045 RepID=UPI00265B4EE6|nr:farnesol dehydrogenase [Anopheles coustani]XP_058173147.1 farnesol dehydrogenase [Anopheles ziemanni]